MQVLRMNKLDFLSIFFRCYGTQRVHRNYYEILEISPDSSQKEIRRAFLALSKKWHPDIIGDKGHDKFVKLQEAYNVLSKESTRREYDVNLKYQTYNSYSSQRVRPEYPPRSERVYRSHREWEEHMARGNWTPGKSTSGDFNARRLNMVVWFTVVWMLLAILQFGVLNSRMAANRRNLQYEYQNNYNLMRKNIQGLTWNEQTNIVQDRYDAHIKNQEDNRKSKEE